MKMKSASILAGLLALSFLPCTGAQDNTPISVKDINVTHFEALNYPAIAKSANIKGAVALALSASLLLPQRPSQGPSQSPKEIVDLLWKMATEGKLLTNDGWQRAGGFFAHSTTPPSNNIINVVSNSWGPADESIKGNAAEVVMGFVDEGKIDATLHYIPPQKTDAIKTGMVYHLILAPTHWPIFGSDGKTVIKEMTGPAAWQIEGVPDTTWTTVNTAIRYVLEMREKTTDPAIRKNSEETLAKLMNLH